MPSFLQKFFRHKLAWAGAIVVCGWLLAGALAPRLVPHDPLAQVIAQRYHPPSWQYPLGTDQFGRDVLSRLILGARVSLTLGFSVTALALLLGATLGALAGYAGGRLDGVIMRLVELLLAFPVVYLLTSFVALFGTDWRKLVLVMAATMWMDIARLLRAEVMSLKQRDFIKAAQVLGLSRGRIILRHLLPNALPPVIALMALRLADVILIESSLSFLGLGVQPPEVSWGSIIRDGRDVLASAWWIVTFPGLAITLTAIGLHWIGEGLRQAFTP